VALPDVIPIRRIADYRTDRVGRHPGGQFFACVTGAYRQGASIGQEWQQHQRWYAVLHRFDREGGHVGSDIWFAGVAADGLQVRERADEVLAGWLAAIGQVSYEDIAIKPFQVLFDGVFGLVDESDDDPDEGHGGDWAELYPNRLGFHEPWDGDYDT
jgi:hypothetical protein